MILGRKAASLRGCTPTYGSNTMVSERRSPPIELIWRPGAGSLILIGGTTDAWRGTEHIDRAAIERAPRDRPVAFVPAADCPPGYGESFLQVYASLGAPTGYVVPIHDRSSARDSANARLIAEAGLVYFGGGETTELLASMTGTPALDAVADAYEAGAVIVGMSAGAIALSAWGVPQDPDIGLLQGWAWLPETIVSVHHTSARDQILERVVNERPGMLGIGLAEDVAVTLAPGEEMQVLGSPTPTFIRAEQ
jgi:cyanophycinase